MTAEASADTTLVRAPRELLSAGVIGAAWTTGWSSSHRFELPMQCHQKSFSQHMTASFSPREGRQKSVFTEKRAGTTGWKKKNAGRNPDATC